MTVTNADTPVALRPVYVTQPSLLDATSEERQAFEDGRLSLLVEERARYDSRTWGGHVHAGAFLGYDGPFSTVHVMSAPAGGEIRGYVRIDGMLYLRSPSYLDAWDALDEEVSRQLGCPVVVKEVTR